MMLVNQIILIFNILNIINACIPDYPWDASKPMPPWGGCVPANTYNFDYWNALYSQSTQCSISNDQNPQICDQKTYTCQRSCTSDSQCVFEYIGQPTKKLTCSTRHFTNYYCYFPANNNVYERAPFDVTFCQCTSDSQCLFGLKCNDGICACQSDAQCGPSQICVNGPYSWDQMGGNSRGPYFKDARPFGDCSCDVGRPEESCNFNGYCVLRYDNDNNRAHPTMQSVPNGGMRTAGVCRCYKGWGGKFCEINYARKQKCNNHGVPLCTSGYSPDGSVAVLSLNTNTNLNLFPCKSNLVGFNDAADGKPVPGSVGCQCDVGYGPDIASSPTYQCATTVPCASQGNKLGTVEADQWCRCYGDFYDYRGISGLDIPIKPGQCNANCRKDRCNNHGSCSGDPANGIAYNNKCTCDYGWTTSDYQKSQNDQQKEYFEMRSYCDIPYDIVNGVQVNCGYYAVAKDNQCVLKPEYASKSSQFFISGTTGLLTRKCPIVSGGSFIGLECGGPLLGQCVSDGHNGKQCLCNNGFMGDDCLTLTCPNSLYVNGAVCSGNGFCNNPTPLIPSQGRCICKAGFFGEACERRAIDCAQSQPVYPFQKSQQGIPDLIAQVQQIA